MFCGDGFSRPDACCFLPLPAWRLFGAPISGVVSSDATVALHGGSEINGGWMGSRQTVLPGVAETRELHAECRRVGTFYRRQMLPARKERRGGAPEHPWLACENILAFLSHCLPTPLVSAI